MRSTARFLRTEVPTVKEEERGGGGHKAAAGFSAHDFEDIFI